MHHLNIFFIVTGAIGILLPIVAPSNNRQAERRLFWIGFLIALTSAFFIAYPPDWKAGIGWALLTSFLMLWRAYFSTSNIKIGGKIYAFHVEDSRPDPPPITTPRIGTAEGDHDTAHDAYSGLGLTTAKKMWWLMVFLMAICSVNVIAYVHDKERPLLAGVMTALLVVGAAGYGYAGDASWGYPIARGQYLQFIIISVITLGVFTVFYIGGYYAGKRWPWRNKRSLEYRAHPRHQKKEPS